MVLLTSDGQQCLATLLGEGRATSIIPAEHKTFQATFEDRCQMLSEGHLGSESFCQGLLLSGGPD